jgi:acyl-CoA reductase-like NAD-dependent aldehyde dehydrogenase
MAQKYYHLINGEKIGGEDWIERRNPANTDEVIGLFPKGTAKIAQAAVEAAALAQPKWAAIPPPARGEILFRAAELIDSGLQELSELMTREEGKTLSESRAEVVRARDIFRFYAAEGRRMSGETLPADKPNSLLFTRREPLGMVSIITPWNFPMAIPAWKLGPALISGCAVVFKPASLVPLCGLRLVEIFHEAGLPAGVLNFVTGAGRDVGEELVGNPLVKGISFTGSYIIGNHIHHLAADHMARTQLEMGGKNPLIVLDDADLNLAVNLAIAGGFGLTGQACTATSRLIVQRGILPEFSHLLVERAEALKVGNGMEGAQMGPAVDQDQFNIDMEYIQLAQQEGAKLLSGGRQIPASKPGFFLNPTIFSDVTPGMRIAQEEIFGPVVGIMDVEDLDQAIEYANNAEFGLSAGLVTTNLRSAMIFAERIEAGVVKINQTTGGVAIQAPFGGIKKSSSNTFREQGKTAIDFFSRSKSVYLDY